MHLPCRLPVLSKLAGLNNITYCKGSAKEKVAWPRIATPSYEHDDIIVIRY